MADLPTPRALLDDDDDDDDDATNQWMEDLARQAGDSLSGKVKTDLLSLKTLRQMKQRILLLERQRDELEQSNHQTKTQMERVQSFADSKSSLEKLIGPEQPGAVQAAAITALSAAA